MGDKNNLETLTAMVHELAAEMRAFKEEMTAYSHSVDTQPACDFQQD
jgi:hypothetical protein